MRSLLLHYLFALLVFVAYARAAVSFTSPVAGKSYAVADGITLKWKDDGNTPDISTFTSSTILLLTGSNADLIPVTTVVEDAAYSTLDGTYSVTISPGVAANGVFLIQMTSVISNGPAYVINYTPRFQLTGMTGTIVADDGGDTDPPAQAYYPVASGTASTASNAIPTDPFEVPYNDQATWLTRYAPMQVQPGSKVTATNTDPLFSSTSWSVFKTFASPASQLTTTTTGYDYTLTSVINGAPTALSPADDGGSHQDSHNGVSQKRKKLIRRWDDYDIEEQENAA
ncbi:uncharacterized protein V2V93DRAFT_373156 [Kockiozyma suomiensis]|uniref:uncharacterized protein n=1 Tax=Kockiozyma suomiensis TaxID=1337062 RepID=UPI003343E09C